jgi:hypothetical protein
LKELLRKEEASPRKVLQNNKAALEGNPAFKFILSKQGR